MYERVTLGLAQLAAEQPLEVLQEYMDFVERSPPSNERTWFELNPASWATIKANGPEKIAAARYMHGSIRLADVLIRNRRKFDKGYLDDIQRLENELRSDLLWQTGSAASLLNVTASTINSLSRLILGILKPFVPLGLQWNIVFDAIDQIFRTGAYFDRRSWDQAILAATQQALMEDVFTRSSVLRQLLAEFAKFAESLTRIQDSELDRVRLRREIERQLDAIKRELEMFQKSGDEEAGYPLVINELLRQPRYVMAVIGDYERWTGKRVAEASLSSLMWPSGPSAQFPTFLACTMPFALLLGIRARERLVRHNVDKS